MDYMRIKPIVFSYTNKLAFLSFFYTIFTFSLFYSTASIDDNSSMVISNSIYDIYTDCKNKKILSNKIHLDLTLQNVLNKNPESFNTQISINKEGKMLGYKSSKLRSISYCLEKEIINILIKNDSFSHNEKHVYWLNITNKH